jgi:perosamine synthetase
MRSRSDRASRAVDYVAAVPRIPLAAPDLSGNELAYVTDAVRSSWISSIGPYVERFEEEFASVCGARVALSVCNGTAALHIALLALGAGPGDEIIVPSLTYVATANAVRYTGAEPIFADVDRATWCLDPESVAAAVTPRTRGIVAVHLYGHPADMDELGAVASRHDLWVVEDAAEAHLATYKSRPVGSLGRMATFSFYGNKPFTSGEGGAVTTDPPELEQKARLLRGQGMDPERRYYFPITGYNYRLTNVACALLCAQLERKEALIARRREIFALYRELLDDVPGLEFQPAADWAEPTPWLFSVLVDERRYGKSRDELADALAKDGIETRPFFIPLHTLPPFRKPSLGPAKSLPVTEDLAARGLNLPTYTQLGDAEVVAVAEAVARWTS